MEELETLKARKMAALCFGEIVRVYIDAYNPRYARSGKPVESVSSRTADHRNRFRCMVFNETLKSIGEIRRLGNRRKGHMPFIVIERYFQPGIHKRGSGFYLGSSVRPISALSMACAACRPSRIAHTTSDCPRRISPAANTLGRDVR